MKNKRVKSVYDGITIKRRYKNYGDIVKENLDDIRLEQTSLGCKIFLGNIEVGNLSYFHNSFIFRNDFVPKGECRALISYIRNRFDCTDHNFQYLYIRPLELEQRGEKIYQGDVKVAKVKDGKGYLIRDRKFYQNIEELEKYFFNKKIKF